MMFASTVFLLFLALPSAGGIAESGMIKIESGCFEMGCKQGDALCDSSEKPAHKVCISEFLIDRTEVTKKDYGTCVASGYCKTGADYSCVKEDNDCPDKPVTGVTWHEASAFCKWKGKSLPTEAQWEFAARGIESRLYPWGNSEPSNEKVAIDNDFAKEEKMMPVCASPAGNTSSGICDMAGNAFEWVSDWFSETWHAKQKDIKNPHGPCGGQAACADSKHKVIKGGSAGSSLTLLRSSARYFASPSQRLPFIGFRCVKNQ